MEPINTTELTFQQSQLECLESAAPESSTLLAAPPESGSYFTSLLELPANEAVKLLYSPETNSLNSTPIFPTTSIPLKQEPLESNSSPDLSIPNKDQKSAKRKDPEKKVNRSAKKSKTETSEDVSYVHVRARRGQATDRHSLAERARREKINAKMKLLQQMVPGCDKISGTAMVLDEIINHVQSLQRQVELLSIRLADVYRRFGINFDSLLGAENGSVMDSNFPCMVTPLTWLEGQLNGNREQFQHSWHFDGLHQQPVLGVREEHIPNFITPEKSLLSYDSPANLDPLHSNQQKMEL